MRESNITSAVHTADAAVRTGGGYLWGIILYAAASPTAILYDSASAAGTKLLDVSGATVVILPHPIRFTTGLYLDIGGTTPVATVLFE